LFLIVTFYVFADASKMLFLRKYPRPELTVVSWRKKMTMTFNSARSALCFVSLAFVMAAVSSCKNDELTCNKAMRSFYDNRCALVESGYVIPVEDAIEGCSDLEDVARDSGCSSIFDDALACLNERSNSSSTPDEAVAIECQGCDAQIDAVYSCINGSNLVNDGSGDEMTASLSWYSSPCSELGGTTTATGACYISCNSDADCPTDELYCNVNSVWTWFACTAKESERLTNGCGVGWYHDGYGCNMACDGSSSQCPSGWQCVEEIMTSESSHFCSGYTGGGGSSSLCPDWCGFPYCDGSCAGCC
jgi:hypothetical protein